MTIDEIFQIFRRSMSGSGRGINFPRNTPREKTYLWRWLSAFKSKADGWGLNEETTALFIRYIIDYAKSTNQLHRGASILSNPDILKICYKRLKEEIVFQDESIRNLEKEKKFVEDRGDLSHRPSGGYCNLTRWYLSGQIGRKFVALSKKCSEVLTTMPPDERSEFPNTLELLKARTSALSGGADDISEIMGTDMNWAGVPNYCKPSALSSSSANDE